MGGEGTQIVRSELTFQHVKEKRKLACGGSQGYKYLCIRVAVLRLFSRVYICKSFNTVFVHTPGVLCATSFCLRSFNLKLARICSQVWFGRGRAMHVEDASSGVAPADFDRYRWLCDPGKVGWVYCEYILFFSGDVTEVRIFVKCR